VRKILTLILLIISATVSANQPGWYETSVNAQCTGQQFESVDAAVECYANSQTTLYTSELIPGYPNQWTTLAQTKYLANDNGGPGYTIGFVCPEGTDRVNNSGVFECTGDPPPPQCAEGMPMHWYHIDASEAATGAYNCVGGCVYQLTEYNPTTHPIPSDLIETLGLPPGTTTTYGPGSGVATGSACEAPTNPEKQWWTQENVAFPQPEEIPVGEGTEDKEEQDPGKDKTFSEPPLIEWDKPNPGDKTETTKDYEIHSDGKATSVQQNGSEVVITTNNGQHYVKTTTVTKITYADGSTKTTTEVTYSDSGSNTVITNYDWVNNTRSTSSSSTPGSTGGSTTVTTTDADGNETGSETTSEGDCVGEDCGDEGTTIWKPGSGTLPGEGDPLYETKYEDGIQGIWQAKQDAIMNTELITAVQNMVPSISGGGCPSFSMSLDVGPVSFGNGTFDIPCYIYDVIGLIILASATFAAWWIVF
jgi:hypothetical protein